MVRKIEEENRQKKLGTPCQDLFVKPEKIGYITGSKIDFRPDMDCEGKKNSDTYYPAFVYDAVITGESCAFKIS